MATEPRRGPGDSMPVAVLPAPTLEALAMLRPGRNVAWLLALALSSGVAFAQTRAMAGKIQSKAVPPIVQPEGGTALKAEDDRRRQAAVKHPTQKTRAKTRIKRQTEPKPRSLAQSRLKAKPRPGQADALRQPLAGQADSAAMEARWQEVQTTLRPTRLIVVCDEFERDFPSTRFAQQIKAIQAGARQALDIQRSAGLSGDLFEDAVGDSDYRDNLIKAVRGDKDAAYRIALAYRTGRSGIAASPRRSEQWLRFAAELGNGRASWELAEAYNLEGLVADAARFEKKALDLGYQPPPRLPTRGY